ncbi:VOC family protein [Streptomyces hesseae]|uniref:VOC family protein n=1 Tax=Streptomyces hesseae TaxID=3075519 RepID=A0ABU2SJR4_9ACTN|nr:VOC family protein [Streptomyces sp. DSM 40473]MDT0449214.1 VOC family protein [Streptomyces sp. DSM 40473]
MAGTPTFFVTPMIYCDGALEAIAFYEDALDAKEVAGSRMLASYLPGMADVPGMDRTVVYSKLLFTDGSGLSVADRFGDPTAKHGPVTGNNLHIGLQHTDLAEQKTAFGKLAAGGVVHEALEPKPWGASYGIVQDRYGVIWEMNCCTG